MKSVRKKVVYQVLWTEDQVGALVYDQIFDQVSDQVWRQVELQVWGQVKNEIS